MCRIAVVIIFAFILTGCTKKEASICFKVKFIGAMCGDKVYQIIDPTYENLGQDNWFDGLSGNTYNNVFKQRNWCTEISVGADKIGTVSISEESVPVNCATCAAVYPSAMPAAILSIIPCSQ